MAFFTRGFFGRLFVPRTMRRVMTPKRQVRRVLTPRPVKQARRVAHPVSTAKYNAQRAVITRARSGRKKGGWL